MSLHAHQFVETYDGMVGFGLNREIDEKTVMWYLQKFSDDAVMQRMIGSLSNGELTEIFDMISRLLKTHLSEPEYHRLFLKDDHHH